MPNFLPRFKLCLLCCALAQGVGLTCAVQSASLRPPDAVSAADGSPPRAASHLSSGSVLRLGNMDDKLRPTPSKTPVDLTAKHPQDTANEAVASPLYSSSDQGIATGFACALTPEDKERYTTMHGQTWLVDDGVLGQIDNDLQMLVNCTKQGDVLAFNVTGVVRPSSPVTIPWQLTLTTQVSGVDSKDAVSQSSTTETRFTCPHKNTGLFLVESRNVTFVDLIIEDCVFDGTHEARSVIEVAACRTEAAAGLVALHRFTFRQNDLTAASALRLSSPSCSELEMVEVEISDNVCSGEACGVYLAQRNRLEDCTVSGNRVAAADGQQSSLFYGHNSSRTTIQGFATSENNLTIIRIEEGDISLSNASFRRNALSTRVDEGMKSNCIHSMRSSVQIENCTFGANEGFRGSVIYGNESKISVFGSVFKDNVAFDKGACVHVEGSEIEFKHTKALNNTANDRGGFVYALNSTVTLEYTDATANSAERSGGFMYSSSSTVKLSDTNAADNKAQWGGCVYGKNSKVTLDHTYATASRAAYGAFLYAKVSNVTLDRTNATASRATYGAFLYAKVSNVTLDRTDATDNSAKKSGGFLYSDNSTVKLSETNAADNTAQWGGCVYALNSSVMLNGTNATDNSAQKDGGFMYLDNSTVTLSDTFATANSAERSGGFMYSSSSTVKFSDTNVADNKAQWGGFLDAENSTVMLDRTNATDNSAENSGGFAWAKESDVTLEDTNAIGNSAKRSGGFLYSSNSTVKLSETNAADNRAQYGGFTRAKESDVKLEDTNAIGNSAENSGGFMYSSNSTVKLAETNTVNNKAQWGGCVYAVNSSVTLNGTNATANSGQDYGGFMHAKRSNVTLERTNATANVATFGGFIHAKNSTVKLDDTNVSSNTAEFGGFTHVENSNVTLQGSDALANSAREYGAFMWALKSTVKLDEANAASNNAKLGGFVYARESNVTLERTIATSNSAQEHGGFAHVENSNVTLERIDASANSARVHGGFMRALSSTVKLSDTNAANNAAQWGGFMHIEESNVTLDHTTATSNSAQGHGGFVYARNSTMRLDETNADSNRAKQGGFVFALESNLTLEHTKAANNRATLGGFMYTTSSAVTMSYATAVNCTSKTGGFMYVSLSTLSISQSQFAHNVARSYGGFAVFKGISSILMYNSTVERGRSENGGSIRLKKSHFVARNLSILHCEAGENGGGVMGSAASTFRCLDCTFRNNSAKHGNGGAVFFDAHSDHTLPLQLVRNHVEENTAELGGGVFFVSSESDTKCLARSIHCPAMALVDTQFSGNEANVAGGAVFTGYLEAILLSCVSTSSDVGLRFYENKESKALSQVKSDKDICPSWKDNHGGVYGPIVGTYAATAEMTLDDTNKAVCVSGGENCVVEGYRIGTDLPTATVELVDGLKQRPAINYCPVNASMSSASNKFLLGSIVRPMENGSFTFQSVRGFVPPGEYNLIVEFDRKVIRDIGITVRIDICSVGEIVSAAGFCESCSSTTYNFIFSATFCHPCPENGNCESRVITPEDGYWQKTPCSHHFRRCLPASVCEFDKRGENLNTMVRDVSSCDFEEEWIEEYTQAQCAEGHTGPLCGSCEEDFGSGLSSECKRCLKGFFNVAYILASVIILLGVTGITIHGTVGALRGDVVQIREQSAPSTSAEQIESPRLGTEVQAVGVPASEKTLAKWKAVEMLKITLSYVQTTVLLASIDVGWAIPVIVMAEAAELLGGLASDGIRRSVVCLTSKHLSLHPTALSLVVSVCVVPCAVLLCWIVFWTTRSARPESNRLQRFLSKRSVLSAMVIWYVTLVPVLKTALSVFLCVDVHDSADFAQVNATHVYWAVDTGMRCYEGDHAKLLYGVVVAFVCPVYGGLLALFVFFLLSAPQHLAHKSSWAYQTTGFLYRSYRMDRRRYWEVAVVARKAIIAFLVFCAHLFDSGVPITGVAYIIMLAILVHIMARPYREEFKGLNGMELASLFVSLATSLAAVMLKDESYPEDFTRVLLTAACALLNVVAFCVFLSYILKFATEYLKYKLRERDENFAPDAGMFRVLAHWVSYEVRHLIGKTCPTSEYTEIAESSAAEA